MITKDGLIRIKWAGMNTPFIEIQRDDKRIYPNKRELLSIREAINMFVRAYPESFTEQQIDLIDSMDDESWSVPMTKDISKIEEEQNINKQRWIVLNNIALEAGFDDDAFAYTEFSLMPLFRAIVEECAKQAELQARSYSGENNEAAGCHGAAMAIRTFGETLGVKGKHG